MEKNENLLGGLGALFIALSFLPYVGGVLGLAGIVILLVAMKRFADRASRPELFTDLVKGLVIWFVGTLFGLSGLTFVGLYEGKGLSYAFILFVIIGYLSTVGGAYFIKKVFDELCQLLSDDLFSLAGKLIFWGAVLTLLIIGAVVMWVGWILATVAFFRQMSKYSSVEE
jgi:uncharacterized membrane protein